MKNELSSLALVPSAPNAAIQKLKTDELHHHLRNLVKEERRIGVEVLEALREIEFRRAHCELDYSSLFSYCVKELGYSESQAYRRVEAMRALKGVPELKEKIESGALTMTTVSMVQSAARKSQVSVEEKKTLFQRMEGKPASEVELELKATDAPHMHWLEITDEAKKLLTRVKEVGAARFRDLNPSSSELILMVAGEWLQKNDPSILAEAKEVPAPTEVSKEVSLATKKETSISFSSPSLRKNSCVKLQSRYIPREVKRSIWRRDQGRCTFRSQTGRQCESRYALQADHVTPFADGGSSRDPANLRLLCPAHNRARVPRWTKS